MENRFEVIKSVMKLSRATRRRSPKAESVLPFPVARTLSVLAENEGATSRELCEILDVRPSSLSELLGKMETEGFVTRETSETDKRAAKVLLTGAGKAAAADLKANMEKHVADFSACFTDEEAEQFCALADKLSAHLEASAPEDGRPCGRGRRPFGPDAPFCPGKGPFGPGRGHGPFHGPKKEFCRYHRPFGRA